MSKYLKHRPSPSLVISLVALFVALSGTAVAASLITGANIKDGSITGKDIKNRSVGAGKLTLAAVANLKGQKGDTGPQGPQGVQGVPGPFPDVLASGKTLRGVFVVGGPASAGGQTFLGSLSYVYALAATPTVHYINAGDPLPADCPGTATRPEASPGHLCVYESAAFNAGSRGVQQNTTGGAGVGATIFVFAAAAGGVEIRGTWAVTAA